MFCDNEPYNPILVHSIKTSKTAGTSCREQQWLQTDTWRISVKHNNQFPSGNVFHQRTG